jgi:acetyl-CoA acetyltransferase
VEVEAGRERKMSGEVAILGVGMHPWGKWGRNFVEYGVKAARDALKDAAVPWKDVRFISGGATVRCGYPGYVAGATFAQALGWQGAEVNTSYAACASGSQALAAARAKILSGGAEVALVVGADTTPKGFLAPAKGYRPDDPDWVRFHLGITNPTYFALYARRRMALYGATEQDFAAVKVKNAEHGFSNPNARYRKKFTLEEVLGSAMVADPLRLFQICATSDGGAAIVISSLDYARRHGHSHPVRIAAISTVTPRYASGDLEMPDIATDSAAVVQAHSFRASLAKKAYEEAGIGPKDVSLAEVYDLASSMELDWMEHLGLCAEGQAEQLLRSGATRIGGRIPVNASGGLACFGEAVPAQALMQVCELTWQLRGAAGARQVEGARVGITANQGLFGHGSSVIVKR